MRKSYKYRIYPTKSQASHLENTFSMCRHLYNWNLQERIESYEEDNKSVTYTQQQNQLPSLKKKKPWFKSVHSQVLQDTLRRLEVAFQTFFNQKEIGFPKFKKKGQYTSITYPQFSESPKDGFFILPKLGKMKIKFHRAFPNNSIIKTCTIKKEADKWFACFSWEDSTFSIEPKQDFSSPIGIDLGLIDFFYGSSGVCCKVPRFLRTSERKLQVLQRRLSKTQKRTSKYYKILKSLQKRHYKVKCQRHDFIHKQVNVLLENADLIIHENLQIKNMLRRPAKKQDENGKFLPNGASQKSGLNKSICDVGWYKFLNILRYKCDFLGKKSFGVAPHHTSQKCSDCGEMVKKSLSTRTHCCHSCGLILNRDHNAANNILRLGLESLGISLEAPTITAKAV